jgi:hypothetical protein
MGKALRRFASSLQGSQFTVQLPGEATPHRNHYFALLFASLSPDLIGNIPSSSSTLMREFTTEQLSSLAIHQPTDE